MLCLCYNDPSIQPGMHSSVTIHAPLVILGARWLIILSEAEQAEGALSGTQHFPPAISLPILCDHTD